ncbi:MAG: acetate--CoA ligase family protein [Oligoflexales bacterium]|nr:acetate--CoA ligase family protein [Oligoflexales bacterium]
MLNEALINPKSILVVGGSNDKQKPGGAVLANILAGSYKGGLYALNPKEQIVQGVPCIKPNDEFPRIDLAIIAVSSQYVRENVEFLVSKGVRAFIILSAGFSEMGDEGRRAEKEITNIITRNGGSLIGPNCIGVMTHHYNGVFAGPIPRLDPRGCDFASGSGATAVFVEEAGIMLGIPFASIFSVGNSAQIGVEEIIQYWDENFDPDTSSRVKLLYMENIKKPQMLLKHASSLVRKGCKIAAIKAGNTDAGSRAASSHTGALASSDSAVMALFEKAGIIRCDGRNDLILTASILLHPPMNGNNMAVITHAGGPGVMLTDALSNSGINVPRIEGDEAKALLGDLFPGSSVANPIDFLATGTHEQAARIIDFIENKAEGINGMAFIFGNPGLFDVSPTYKVLHEKMNTCKKPIFPILPSITTASDAIEYFKSLKHWYFPDEVSFGKALGKVLAVRRPYDGSSAQVKVDVASIRKVIDDNCSGYLSPRDVQKLLDAASIPRVLEFVCDRIDDLAELTEKTGFPVVMKVVGPVHKTDIGGVVIGVDSIEKARSEFARMMALADARGVLIQPMIKGLEIFVGAKREEQFGHMVVCGLGGIFIEVFKDTRIGLTPVSKDEASLMIKNLKSYPLIKGIRGRDGISEELFAEIITKVSALVMAAPEIIEMDINPFMGIGDSIRAVDARIRIEKEKIPVFS